MVSRSSRAPHAILYVGQTERHLKQRYFEHIRYIKYISHGLHMFYVSSKMYKHIRVDYSKTLRLFCMSKVYPWTYWNNSIFIYLIIRTNPYQKNILEPAILYLALFTPLHDTLHNLLRTCVPYLSYSTVLAVTTNTCRSFDMVRAYVLSTCTSYSNICNLYVIFSFSCYFSGHL